MGKCLGIVFLENLISVTKESVFRINFGISSGWSVSFCKTIFGMVLAHQPLRRPKHKQKEEAAGHEGEAGKNGEDRQQKRHLILVQFSGANM